MSLTYIVEPLTIEAAKVLEHLPAEVQPSNDNRFPSPNEFLAACKSLDGYSVRHEVLASMFSIDVERVSDPKSHACVSFAVEPHQLSLAARFSIDRCDPRTAFLILSRVAQICGPFTYHDDTIMYPLVISANDDPDELLEYYEASTIGPDDRPEEDDFRLFHDPRY